MSYGLELAGRIALVTGASGGIGGAICRRLVGEVAGIADAYGSNPEPAEALAAEIVSGGGTARALGSDMAEASAPERLIDDVEAALGPVDFLVANHGLARQARYEDVDAVAFDHTLAVTLRAPFLLARCALPGMRERGFGRVLFISSVAAFRGGVIGPDYACSKAGLHGLAHFLASQVAADGVTVNVLAPGFAERLVGTVSVTRGA
ncbi:MAG: SDR family NAD(P)-dependent oxidoreductase [Pseudonocardiaceae bacterium]